MVEPYLSGAVRAAFDAWVESAAARFGASLEFREIRKGVQALSSLYVQRREGADLSARAIEGQGTRAALVTYYAPLHFLAAWHALAELGPERLGSVSRVWDLGCGSGATGAAVALAVGADEVIGVDRSGFALGEARRTYAAFGLLGRTRRGRIPAAAPTPKPSELWVLGWAVNELEESNRRALFQTLTGALEAGVALVLLEPLAGSAVPWWRPWALALDDRGVWEGTLKRSLARPEWIARLDKASGLDHRVIGARILAGPLA